MNDTACKLKLALIFDFNWVNFAFQTRFAQLDDPERLRQSIDEFLEKVFLTDSILLYTPSQVALAAILHAASKASANLDYYVTDILFSKEHLAGIIEAVKSKCICNY